MKIFIPQVFKRLVINTLPSFVLLLSFPGLSHSTIISELFITEIMANPEAVSDSNGEWFELFNPTNDIFSFNDILLSDNGSNHHLITDSEQLLIQPGDYFVFGRNGNELENGGFMADYIYSSFTLGNSDDEIILSDSIGNILQLEYDNGFVTSGHSLELTSQDMAISSYETTTAFSYGAGDFGTPGTSGSHPFTTASVPEPSSILLLLTGFVFAGYQARRDSNT